MKYKYLYRLVAIIILALIVPVILFLKFFWQRSFEELEQSNEVYYESRLDGYISLYDAKILELELFAASISAESRVSTSAFYDGAEGLYNNAYQLYILANEMKKNYDRYDFSDWGIYFYDIDKIISPGYAATYKQYALRFPGGDGKIENEQLAEFFSLENYSSSKIIFSTTNTSDNYDGKMLVGFCTKIGRNNDKALIFFEMSPKDIVDSLVIISDPGVAYYFLDKESNRVLCSWGDEVEANADMVMSSEVVREITGMEQKVLYKKDSDYPPLSFAIYISEDSLHSNIINYANNMQTLLMVTAVILCIVCMGAVYLSYKPVYELMHELDYSGGSEFEVVRGILDKKNSKITEQEQLIMDLIMKHLIYGGHVPEQKIKQLGIDASMKYYCVFLLDGYVLLSGEVEKLTNTIEKKYASRLFITDWQDGKSSIFILFSKNDDSKGVQEILTEWMNDCFVEEFPLYVGKTVDKLDDIQFSLRSCLKQLKGNEAEETKPKADVEEDREEQQSNLKEDILVYMDLNYRDANLSQVQVADLFGVSSYTLSRLFKNQIGVGFTEYLVSKRIEYAKELLLTTSYSISEVAVMSGFSGIKYFSSAFKLYVGVSPSAFRKKD